MQHIKHSIADGYGDDIVMTPNDAMQAFTPQPIETAPTDGTHILLYGMHDDEEDETGWCEGYFDLGNSVQIGWYAITNYPMYTTHWLPLPRTPEQ